MRHSSVTPSSALAGCAGTHTSGTHTSGTHTSDGHATGPRRVRTRSALVLATGLALGAALLGAPIAQADPTQDTTPAQSYLDQETIGPNIGGWAAMDGGIEARPYVKRLSIVNGADEKVAIDNTLDVVNPAPFGNLDVTVSPTNLCAPGTDPVPGQCYDTPNRVQVTIGYYDGEEAFHTNFSNPSAPDFMVYEDPVTIDENTVFDLTLGLNTLGQSLRWTWVSGEPVFWQVTSIGQPEATMRIKFKPTQFPQASNGGGCTQIPVNDTCEFATGEEYRLNASLILSLDDTLSEAFTGSLFGTAKAFLGSLDTVPSPTGAPQMTYGIAAPKTVDGAANTPQLWAVVSDAALLNHFGIAPGADPSGAFAVSVTGTSTSPAITWDKWAAASEGTDGYRISIAPMAVSTQFLPNGIIPRSGMAVPRGTVAKALKVTLKRKGAAPAVSSSYKAVTKKTTVTFNAGRTQRDACAAKNTTCRVTVRKVSSLVSAKTTFLKLGAASVGANSVTATVVTETRSAPRKTRLLVTLEKRKGTGAWTYVASAVTEVS